MLLILYDDQLKYLCLLLGSSLIDYSYLSLYAFAIPKSILISVLWLRRSLNSRLIKQPWRMELKLIYECPNVRLQTPVKTLTTALYGGLQALVHCTVITNHCVNRLGGLLLIFRWLGVNLLTFARSLERVLVEAKKPDRYEH